MSNNPQTGEPSAVPGDLPHDQCGCGDNAEAEALREITEAKDTIEKGEAEILEGAADVKTGEDKLANAEQELEEARHHKITFFLDREKEVTDKRKLTPNEIISDYGKRDPAKTYLVKIEGHQKESYQGKGDIPIEIHECEQFQMVNIGPTPVSDGTRLTGVKAFVAELEALGYKSTVLKDTSNVVIDYVVPTGKFAGRNVRLGFDVPTDFPMTSPGGVHVSPRIHPNKAGKVHPTEGISDSPNFQAKAGGEWQYWSRPFPDWAPVKKTVGTYMSYVWQLWDSQ